MKSAVKKVFFPILMDDCEFVVSAMVRLLLIYHCNAVKYIIIHNKSRKGECQCENVQKNITINNADAAAQSFCPANYNIYISPVLIFMTSNRFEIDQFRCQGTFQIYGYAVIYQLIAADHTAFPVIIKGNRVIFRNINPS
jgi:hypothetical protein